VGRCASLCTLRRHREASARPLPSPLPGVYSATRALVRLTSATARASGQAAGEGEGAAGESAALIVGLTAAYPYALKQHLRGERDVRELLEAATAASGGAAGGGARRPPALRPLAGCAQQPNLPLAVLDCLTCDMLPLDGERPSRSREGLLER